jgi:hypothetical protein
MDSRGLRGRDLAAELHDPPELRRADQSYEPVARCMPRRPARPSLDALFARLRLVAERHLPRVPIGAMEVNRPRLPIPRRAPHVRERDRGLNVIAPAGGQSSLGRATTTFRCGGSCPYDEGLGWSRAIEPSPRPPLERLNSIRTSAAEATPATPAGDKGPKTMARTTTGSPGPPCANSSRTCGLRLAASASLASRAVSRLLRAASGLLRAERHAKTVASVAPTAPMIAPTVAALSQPLT